MGPKPPLWKSAEGSEEDYFINISSLTVSLMVFGIFPQSPRHQKINSLRSSAL